MGRGDVDVVDGVVELAVDAAYAPRPRRAELLLESEDQLVLVNRIHVGIDLRTQVAYGAVALIVAEAELRSEEHTSELQSLMRISYAVFCLKKTNTTIRPMSTLYTHK